jgi:putative zinc finger/helix-turn-helix YgiT family protein
MQNLKEKPFPWKCGHCREKAVHRSTIEYSTKIEYEGRTYTVTLPDLEVPRCQNCGRLILDSPANRRIDDAFRQQLGLLQPEEIRRNRQALNLTQRELAAHLGIAEATLSRWETGGQIQQRSLDRLLRLYFGLPAVRAALATEGGLGDLRMATTPEVTG